MPVVVVGLHERDAPLELLDRLAIGEDEMPKALAKLSDSPNLSERVVLSTCMRTEVYAFADRFHDGVDDIQQFFSERLSDSKNAIAALEDALTVEFDEPAVRHLFAVASGIDSPVLGEGEVLRQVRSAYEQARAEHAIGPVLDGLFRHAIEVGKRARTETGIARGTTSLAHVAVELASQHLGSGFVDRRVVVVGAGEMGEGILAALKPVVSEAEVVIANRSRSRAVSLARPLGGRGIALDALDAELGEADVLFSATAASDVLLGPDELRTARGAKPRRPLLVVDVAVPRDVDPEVASLPGVTLFDVDDLRSYAEREMESRRAEIVRVEAIIEEELERFAALARGRTVAPVVGALRAWAEGIRAAELERADKTLSELTDEQRAAVDSATRRIVAKILHEPTVEVKRAAGTARGERLADALRALFGL